MNNCENWCPTICENDEKLCPGKVNENNCMTEDICISKDGKIILYNKKGMILNLGQFPIYVPLPQIHYHNRTFIGQPLAPTKSGR